MGIDRAVKSAAHLAEEFEAEAPRLLLEADEDEMNTFTRLSLRMRGEAWLKAAARLRAALPPTEPERTKRPSCGRSPLGSRTSPDEALARHRSRRGPGGGGIDGEHAHRSRGPPACPYRPRHPSARGRPAGVRGEGKCRRGPGTTEGQGRRGGFPVPSEPSGSGRQAVPALGRPGQPRRSRRAASGASHLPDEAGGEGSPGGAAPSRRARARCAATAMPSPTSRPSPTSPSVTCSRRTSSGPWQA